jgi:hypothetical protein
LKNSAAVFQAGKARLRVEHAVFDDEIQTKAAKAACPGIQPGRLKRRRASFQAV